MNDSQQEAVASVFNFPDRLNRRHGPQGYVDYSSYKPWLRDEFLFRCVYCLNRERWEPNGQADFSIDHVLPQSTHPDQMDDYDNLVYACCACNSSRGNLPLPVSLEFGGVGRHINMDASGLIQPLNQFGQRFIDLCHLNRPAAVEFRRNLIRVLEVLSRSDTPSAEAALQHLLGFPSDLPDLARLRPPDGNLRPDGLSTSCFARQQRGELPEVY